MDPSFAAHKHLLRALCNVDMARAAHAVLEVMKERSIQPTFDCYSTVLASYARTHHSAAISRLLSEIRELGSPGEDVRIKIYARIMAACLVSGRNTEATELLAEFRTANAPASWAVEGSLEPLPGQAPTSASAYRDAARRAIEASIPVAAQRAPQPAAESESLASTVTVLSHSEVLAALATDDTPSAMLARSLQQGSPHDQRHEPVGTRGDMEPAYGALVSEVRMREVEAAVEDVGQFLRSIGVVDAVRLATSSELVGDLLSFMLMELRPHRSSILGPPAAADPSYVRRVNALPIAAMEPFVQDIPEAPEMTYAQRRQATRRVVTTLLRDMVNPSARSHAPHPVEFLAFAQHCTSSDDGAAFTAALASPPLLARLWAMAGLGPAPPGFPPELVQQDWSLYAAHPANGTTSLGSEASSTNVDAEGRVRLRPEVAVARRWLAQRLLEQGLWRMARVASRQVRGEAPDALVPIAERGASFLFDQLTHAGVELSVAPLQALLHLGSVRTDERGMAMALRAALQLELQGITFRRTGEIVSLALAVATLNVSEAGLRPLTAVRAQDTLQRLAGLSTDGFTRRRVCTARGLPWLAATTDDHLMARDRSAAHDTARASRSADDDASFDDAPSVSESPSSTRFALERAEAAAAEQRAELCDLLGIPLEALAAAEAAGRAANQDASSGISLARRLVFTTLPEHDARVLWGSVLAKAARRHAALAVKASLQRMQQGNLTSEDRVVLFGSSDNAEHRDLKQVLRESEISDSTGQLLAPDWLDLRRALLHSTASAASLTASGHAARELDAGRTDDATLADAPDALDSAEPPVHGSGGLPGGVSSSARAAIARVPARLLAKPVASWSDGDVVTPELASWLRSRSSSESLAADEAERRGRAFFRELASSEILSSLPEILQRAEPDGSVSLRGASLVLSREVVASLFQQRRRAQSPTHEARRPLRELWSVGSRDSDMPPRSAPPRDSRDLSRGQTTRKANPAVSSPRPRRTGPSVPPQDR